MIGTAEFEQRVIDRSHELLPEVLSVLLTTPAPAGRERRVAEALIEWGNSRPGTRWTVQPLDGESANLRIDVGEGLPLAFYAHLDTSLSGDPTFDFPLTGVRTPPPAPTIGDVVTGPGLAVAKGPAACAVAAVVATAEVAVALDLPCPPGVVLLTAGGTHRSPTNGVELRLPAGLDRGLGYGVEAALDAGFDVSAVVNVKGGAPGIMYEEPGCLLLRIGVTDRMVAIPGRGDAGGAAVRVSAAALAVERWRREYRASGAGDQIAPDAGVGAIESGLPYKPDLLPGMAALYVYVVLLPDADVDALRAELHERALSAVQEVDATVRPEEVTVTAYGFHPAARTSPDEPIVALARDIWQESVGEEFEVTGYRGSTDGVIFRRHGLPTVRLGPTARAEPDDPTVERIERHTLEQFTTVYAQLLHRFEQGGST